MSPWSGGGAGGWACAAENLVAVEVDSDGDGDQGRRRRFRLGLVGDVAKGGVALARPLAQFSSEHLQAHVRDDGLGEGAKRRARAWRPCAPDPLVPPSAVELNRVVHRGEEVGRHHERAHEGRRHGLHQASPAASPDLIGGRIATGHSPVVIPPGRASHEPLKASRKLGGAPRGPANHASYEGLGGPADELGVAGDDAADTVPDKGDHTRAHGVHEADWVAQHVRRAQRLAWRPRREGDVGRWDGLGM